MLEFEFGATADRQICCDDIGSHSLFARLLWMNFPQKKLAHVFKQYMVGHSKSAVAQTQTPLRNSTSN